MPQRRTSIKELRKNRTHQMHNLDIKTDLRKTIKNFTVLIDAKKKDDAKAALAVLFKKIDKATKRNILPKNTADRRKSRFARLLVTLK